MRRAAEEGQKLASAYHGRSFDELLRDTRKGGGADDDSRLYAAMLKKLLSPRRRARLEAWNEDFPEMRMSEEEFLRW